MLNEARSDPHPTAGDFAGLLATLAAIKDAVPQGEDPPLANDIATLTYEGALRSHGRTRGGASRAQIPDRSTPAGNVLPVKDFARRSSSRTDGETWTERRNASQAERKCASITVRMSQEDSAQLRERAAEAEMTVSAYLRSCAFEVESLRGQVKQTLAELKDVRVASANRSAYSEMPGHHKERKSIRKWLAQIFPRHDRNRAALREALPL